MRGLVVVLTFVFVAIFLVGIMVTSSSWMFTSPNNGQSPIDVKGNPLGLLVYNSTYFIQLNKTNSVSEFQLNGYHLQLQYHFNAGGAFFAFPDCLRLMTFDPVSVPILGEYQTNQQDFHWYYNGTQIDVREAIPTGFAESTSTLSVVQLPTFDSIYQQQLTSTTLLGNSTSNPANSTAIGFILTNPRMSVNVVMSFNASQYTGFADALESGGSVYVQINTSMDNTNTSLNILGFIGGLFFFSLPSVPYAIAAIISFSIDVPIAYLCFIFILRIIGAPFGGGGA